jgi:DinB family protein
VISADQSLYRYAPGKWSIRDVVGHLSDTERLFVFRAFWFARGFESPLPSFDQNVAVSAAHAEQRPWSSLVEEFRAVRAATLSFFQTLPDEAWARRGIASGKPFSVRALAYLAAGHVTHHSRILRERYLEAPSIPVSR